MRFTRGFPEGRDVHDGQGEEEAGCRFEGDERTTLDL